MVQENCCTFSYSVWNKIELWATTISLDHGVSENGFSLVGVGMVKFKSFSELLCFFFFFSDYEFFCTSFIYFQSISTFQ